MRHPFLVLHPAKACTEAAAAKQAIKQLQQDMMKAGFIGPRIRSLQMHCLSFFRRSLDQTALLSGP